MNTASCKKVRSILPHLHSWLPSAVQSFPHGMATRGRTQPFFHVQHIQQALSATALTPSLSFFLSSGRESLPQQPQLQSSAWAVPF